jgi:hypothetical protein
MLLRSVKTQSLIKDPFRNPLIVEKGNEEETQLVEADYVTRPNLGDRDLRIGQEHL